MDQSQGFASYRSAEREGPAPLEVRWKVSLLYRRPVSCCGGFTPRMGRLKCKHAKARWRKSWRAFQSKVLGCFASPHAERATSQKALPNPSFKRTANGVSPWPRGRVGYHRPRGQGATPLAAA